MVDHCGDQDISYRGFIIDYDNEAANTIRKLKTKCGIYQRRADNLTGKEEHEKQLRWQHPGLNELWEQYQIMLKLVEKTK